MKGLVLAGGGSHGSYGVGILKHLLGEQQKQYDIITGISVGALNAGFLAQFGKGQEQEAISELEALWVQKIKKNSSVWSYHFPPLISGLWNSGFYSTKALQKTINNVVKQEKIANSGKILRVGAVSLNTGNYQLWTEKDTDVVQGIIASSAFPVFFDNIKARGQDFCDGGVKNTTPLGDAIKAGADEIDVLLLSTNDVSGALSGYNALKTGLRALSIIMHESFVRDLKLCALKNTLPDYKKITLNIYQPTKINGSILSFNSKDIKANMDLGYSNAIKIGPRSQY